VSLPGSAGKLEFPPLFCAMTGVDGKRIRPKERAAGNGAFDTLFRLP
jgi:hypothetical protein